jgi:3'-5' exonuclease
MFIDLETVPNVKSFNDIDERGQALFIKKFIREINDTTSMMGRGVAAEQFYDSNASFYAEFSKVFCVTVGIESNGTLRLKTLIDRNEKRLLSSLLPIIITAKKLVAHNGKLFDFPFLFRRLLINGLAVPDVLNMIGKKPWDLSLEDTKEMWKHMSYKDSASLDTIAWCLGLPSPKTDIDGSHIKELYYLEQKEGVLIFDNDEPLFKRIGAYCEGDVITLANVYQKLKGLPIFTEDKIVRV